MEHRSSVEHRARSISHLALLRPEGLVAFLCPGIGQVGHPAAQEPVFLRQRRVQLVHGGVDDLVGGAALHVLGDGVELDQGDVGHLGYRGEAPRLAGSCASGSFSSCPCSFSLCPWLLLGRLLGQELHLPERLVRYLGLETMPGCPGSHYRKAPAHNCE